MNVKNNGISAISRFVIIFLIILRAATEGYAQASIEVVEGEIVDLGEVREGSVIKRELLIRNSGADTLHISGITASCACTDTRISSNYIAPHDSVSLYVTLNTRKITEKVHQSVTIASNDIKQPVFKIIFKGKVYHLVEVSPKYLNFGTMIENNPLSQIATLSTTQNDTIRITSYFDRKRNLSLSISGHTLTKQQAVEVKATITSEKIHKMITENRDNFIGQIEIQTDSDELPLILINYNGRIKK